MDKVLKAKTVTHSKPETSDTAWDLEGDNAIRVYNCRPETASLQILFRGRFRSDQTGKATRAYRTRATVDMDKNDIKALITTLKESMEDM